MAKFKVISLSPFKIEINQDLKKGDILDISSEFGSQEFALKELIDENTNKLIQKELSQQKQELEKIFKEDLDNKLEINTLQTQQKQAEIINQKDLMIKELQEQKANIEANIENQKKQVKFEQEKIIDQKEANINQLKLEKANLEANIENQKKQIQLEQENKFKDQLNQKEIEINNLKNEITENKRDFEDEKKQISAQYQKEIDDLKRNKNLLGTKDLGNELEDYCEHEIKTQLIDPIGNDGTIEVIRQPLNSDDHKRADFLIKLKPNLNPDNFEDFDLIQEPYFEFKILLEMKAEFPNSKETNKRSNDDAIPKLIKDAKSQKANVAILVTEREKNDLFFIRRKDNRQYETDIELFLVRPEFLVYLISILRIIYLKNLNLSNYKERIQFLDEQKILEDFNSFKSDLLDKTIKNIESNISAIIDSAQKIINQGNNILEKANVIINTHIQTLENKINKYSIENKVIKKINKINK